jgi:hypothetical protein
MSRDCTDLICSIGMQKKNTKLEWSCEGILEADRNSNMRHEGDNALSYKFISTPIFQRDLKYKIVKEDIP